MTEQLLGLRALIEQANLSFRAFEVGRFVKPLSNSNWNSFELGELTWPYPVQQHACFAVVGLNETLDESIIWPLKLPLDEQGKLNLGARDQLVHTLISRASDNAKALAEGKTDELKSAADDIAQAVSLPLIKQAKLNSLIRLAAHAPCAEGFEDAKQWFSNMSEPWQSLSVQAVADVCVRIDQQGIASGLAKQINSIDLSPLETIAELTEGESLKPVLNTALMEKLQSELTSDNRPNTTAALLRMLSGTDRAEDAVLNTLNSAHGLSPECISVISGRAWQTLMNPTICHRFLENLAMLDNGQSFTPVMHQLLYIESLRPFILGAFHQSHLHSNALTQAIQSLLGR